VQTVQGPPGQPQWGPSPFPAGQKTRLFVGGTAARQARIAVPYLGPDPAPSRRAGAVLKVLCVVGVAVRIAQGLAFGQRAGLDRSLALGSISRDALISNTNLLWALGLLRTVSWISLLVGFIVWGRARRPKAMLQAYGEAYVESPYGWIATAPLRLLVLGMVVAGVAARVASTPDRLDSLSRLAQRRDWSAVSCLVWAVYYVLALVVVVLSERALAERLAVSGAHRAGRAPIPFVPPILSAGEREAGKSEGVGWILRTAGLILLLFIAVTFGIVAATEHTAVSLVWTAGFGLVTLLVVRAFVRRYRANH